MDPETKQHFDYERGERIQKFVSDTNERKIKLADPTNYLYDPINNQLIHTELNCTSRIYTSYQEAAQDLGLYYTSDRESLYGDCRTVRVSPEPITLFQKIGSYFH